MARALVFLAEGFEEIEAVTIVDVLRRAGVEVTTAALARIRVTGSHGIVIEANRTLDEVMESRAAGGNTDFDALVLPGGMPGAAHLRDDSRVRALIEAQAKHERLVAAICAGPIALEAAGVLRGRAATAYPGYELRSADYKEERVVVDGHVVTSRGPGTAIEFSLRLAEILAGSATAQKLRTAMLAA